MNTNIHPADTTTTDATTANETEKKHKQEEIIAKQATDIAKTTVDAALNYIRTNLSLESASHLQWFLYFLIIDFMPVL